jgi:OOP family OmpA-OmpF porin
MTAIRTVMPEGWELDLDLREGAAPAEAAISKRGDEIALSGVLPLGLPADRALSMLGPNAGGDGLSSDGDGSTRGWERTLTGLAESMALFSDVTGEISEANLRLSGTLLPGYSTSEVEAWMGTRLPEGWQVSLSAEETPAGEGATRTNLETGATETFRNGFWLADLTFDVSIEACEDATETAFAGEQITFLTSSDRIDDEGAALLSRLAAVANRCLADEEIALEIGGHTDSLGDPAFNLSLSEKRAEAVRGALVARGVGAEAIAATGYGETQPVASNATQDGRARNRRIDFLWSRRDVQ